MSPHHSSVRSYYEGHSIETIGFPIRLLKRLGVSIIVGNLDSDCPSDRLFADYKESRTLLAA